MPNTFLPRDAAAVAVALAEQDSYLAALINRNYENDLLGGGGRGKTVNIRIPATLMARHRDIEDVTNPIILDTLTETQTSITLGTHVYSAVGLSEGDLTLNLTDFSAQVLAPQVSAIVEDIEHTVASALLATPVTAGITYDAANPVATFVALRKALRDNGLPQTALYCVVGTRVYADLLNANALQDASASGSTAALREGNIGRVAGFTVVESNRVGEDDIIAFHRDAFTLAVRAPVVPTGVPFGAVQASNGFNIRYMRDYDAKYTQDRSIVSTFAGMATLPLKRVTRDFTAGTFAVVDVPAVYRVDAGA